MKISKILTIVSVVLTSATLQASAQSIVETWTGTSFGGAWGPANQPDFTPAPGGGGILYTDQAILGGTNNSVDNTGATWASAVTAGSGIYGNFYYTFFSQPVITISTTNVLDGVQAIVFTLTSNAPLSANSVSLDYGAPLSANAFEPIFVGNDPDFGAAIYYYTWEWDVSALPEVSAFSLSWTTPADHSSYFEAGLTQSVPEPTAATLVGAGLALAFLRRKRKNCD